MPVSAVFESALTTALAPAMAQNGGTALELYVRPFASADQIAELIQQFQDKLPALFISIDDGTFNRATKPAGLTRKLDITYNYNLAFALGTSDVIQDRLARLRTTRAIIASTLEDYIIPDADVPAGWGIDPVAITGFTSLNLPHMIIGVVTFTIRARSSCQAVQ